VKFIFKIRSGGIKKWGWIGAAGLAVISLILGMVYRHEMFMWFKTPLIIAVAAPLTGSRQSEGQEMQRAVTLYIDKVNDRGGIRGRPVAVRFYDDRNQTKQALQAADEIVNSGTLLVLGHFSSDTSIAAGRIYNNNGIPAITASASAGQITSENESYFRLIATSEFQGAFIANYIHTSLMIKSACIIFSTDNYGVTLARHFDRAAQGLGLEIKKRWSFNPENRDMNDILLRISTELTSVDDPGAIFIAAAGDDGPKVITALKFAGAEYVIIGPDSFATESFIKGFNKYPQEEKKPGYYSDGIYAVTPYLKDIAEKEGQGFRKDFIGAYGAEPSWVAACYYDAAQIAVLAVQQAEIREEDIRHQRRDVRLALTEMSNPDFPMKGVTGNIYFDRKGDASGSLAVGIYEKQNLMPAFSQYRFSSDYKKDTRVMVVNEKMMTETQLIYAGVDINEIRNLELQKEAATVDFYLWFRFQKDFDDAYITFLNTAAPVQLGKPVMEEKINGGLIRTYHVEGDFKMDANFRRFPFERPVIAIQFHHDKRLKNEMAYIPDMLGLFQKAAPPKKARVNAVTQWDIKDIVVYNDTYPPLEEEDIAGPQDIQTYSQFNTLIHMNKKGITPFIKTFFPIVIILLILLALFQIPKDRVGLRLLIFLTVGIMNAVYYLRIRLFMNFDTVSYMESAFLLIVMGSAISAMLCWTGRKRRKFYAAVEEKNTGGASS
jgi:branched-chain amino acid transport system substrate-binding protein